MLLDREADAKSWRRPGLRNLGPFSVRHTAVELNKMGDSIIHAWTSSPTTYPQVMNIPSAGPEPRSSIWWNSPSFPAPNHTWSIKPRLARAPNSHRTPCRDAPSAGESTGQHPPHISTPSDGRLFLVTRSGIRQPRDPRSPHRLASRLSHGPDGGRTDPAWTDVRGGWACLALRLLRPQYNQARTPGAPGSQCESKAVVTDRAHPAVGVERPFEQPANRRRGLFEP